MKRIAGKVNGSAEPWVASACDDWCSRFGKGAAHGGRIAGGLASVVKANGWGVIRPAWQRYLRETGHPSPSAQDFAAHWSDWRTVAPQPPRAESVGPVLVGPRRLA